eukprot:c30384_g1_i1 orf=118-561(+)
MSSICSDDAATPWRPTPPPLSLSSKSRFIAKNTVRHHYNIRFTAIADGLLYPAGAPLASETFIDDFDNISRASCANNLSKQPEMYLEPNETAPVRVVQIFNPVLVKTDVANFRNLVQKLTGKSGCSKCWNKLRRLNYFQKGAMVELE